MSATRQPRIVIEDLPALEALSEEAMAKVFGAAFTRFRPQVENLEGRELMASSLLASFGSLTAGSQLQQTSKESIRAYTVNQRFVDWAYQDVLHRSATQQELAQNSQALNGGTLTRQQFIDNIRSSSEFAQTQTNELYNRFLGRNVSSQPVPGTNTLESVTNHKITVITEIVNTDEYWNRAGGNFQGFVTNFLRDTGITSLTDVQVFGNCSSFNRTKVREFVNRALGSEAPGLDSNPYRQQVYARLAEGYVNAEVQTRYMQVLGRSATDSELAQARATYNTPSSGLIPDLVIHGNLLNSQEYFNRTQTRLQNTTYSLDLYAFGSGSKTGIGIFSGF